MGRLTDLGSFIGAGGSGGIRGLTFLDSVSSGVPLEIVGGYACAADDVSSLTVVVPDVRVGDVLILCIASDTAAVGTVTDYTRIFYYNYDVDNEVFAHTATTNEDFYYWSKTDGLDGRHAAVMVHLRGVDYSSPDINYYSPAVDANFYFQGLGASDKSRIIILFGALDDDKIATQSDQTGQGYTSLGAAISHYPGATAHVWGKITDGSAETQKIFSANGGNDAMMSITMGLDKAG